MEIKTFLISVIKKNKDKTDTQIAKELIKLKEFSDYQNRIETLRKRINSIRGDHNLGKPKQTFKPTTKIEIKDEIHKDRKEIKLKEEKAISEKKYKEAVKHISQLEKLLDFKNKTESHKIQSIGIKTSKSNADEQATAIALFSDVHFEERIESKKINGFNDYSPEIATERCKIYFENLAKRIEKERRDVDIENLVFACLGDLIHGFIHEEYLTTNYLTPIEASTGVYEILINGLEFLLKDKAVKQLTFIGKVGNHSRITLKPYSSNEALMSYEWAVYQFLQKNFKNEKRIKFILDESYFSYLKVYDKILRFHHGHNVQYRGGIGGLTIPLIKFILRANQQIKADMDFIGHFHTKFNLPNCLVNGSICGFDSYALKIGAQPEEPVQQFQILDSKRGFTTNTPILTTR
jgi:hypothetical protein